MKKRSCADMARHHTHTPVFRGCLSPVFIPAALDESNHLPVEPPDTISRILSLAPMAILHVSDHLPDSPWRT